MSYFSRIFDDRRSVCARQGTDISRGCFDEPARGPQVRTGSNGQVVHDAHGVPAFFDELPDQGGAQKTTAAGNEPIHDHPTSSSILLPLLNDFSDEEDSLCA